MVKTMTGLLSDRFLFFTGHVGIFLLVALTLYTNTIEKDTEVHCWTPSQFSEAHIDYTNAICEYEEHHVVPPGTEDQKIQKTKSDLSWLYISYVIQAVLVCISYFLLSSIITSVKPAAMALKSNTQKHGQTLPKMQSLSKENLVVYVDDESDYDISGNTTSVTMMTSYLLVKLVTALTWVGLGIKSLTGYYSGLPLKDDPEHNHTFLCNFDIRNLGQVHRYTVECVEDDEGVGTIKGEHLVLVNMVLCLMIAAMTILHLMSLMSCGGRNAREFLLRMYPKDKQGIKRNISSCLSDMVLISAVANNLD